MNFLSLSPKINFSPFTFHPHKGIRAFFILLMTGRPSSVWRGDMYSRSKALKTIDYGGLNNPSHEEKGPNWMGWKCWQHNWRWCSMSAISRLTTIKLINRAESSSKQGNGLWNPWRMINYQYIVNHADESSDRLTPGVSLSVSTDL